jgi:hypothetical protein
MTKNKPKPDDKEERKEELLTPQKLKKEVKISPALLKGAVSYMGIREQFYNKPEEPLITLKEFQKGINDYKKLKIKL